MWITKSNHLATGEVQAVRCEVVRLTHSWTVQLGPFAEHSIKVLKNHTVGKIVTLLVDGELFVEASAADIGCHDNEWRCDFHFVGERLLDFEVFKTNKDGIPLNETDHVVERRKYSHKCTITIPNDWDLSSAQLWIDGKNFRELPVRPDSSRKEASASLSPMVMSQTYGIVVPYKVDHAAPSGIVCLAQNLLASAEDSKKTAAGFFAWCYTPTVTTDVVEVHAQSIVGERATDEHS